MRRIAVVTVGRSDYGISLPVLRRLRDEPGVDLLLVVAAAHLSDEFGRTVDVIEADGFRPAARVDVLRTSDAPEWIGESMGRGTAGFARAYAKLAPDLVVVVGDRFEMHAAALAALPFPIPVAHIHGGEVTRGAFDDALRHAITKLSHLHFVATEEYGRRVMQLGEEPWRVVVSGAPALDELYATDLLGRDELARILGMRLDEHPLLVTYHPVTLQHHRTEWQATELLAAVSTYPGPIVLTAPNADTAGRMIRRSMESFVRETSRARLVESLGTRAYFGLMAIAAAMVGNSSSGIVEAPSFELPVVNVGIRQEGRARAANVIDTGYGRAEVVEGMQRALEPEFRRGLLGLVNPYCSGDASGIIVKYLSDVPLDERLVLKRFVDLPAAHL